MAIEIKYDGKIYLNGVEWKYHSSSKISGKRALEKLARQLNLPINYFESLEKETGRWMIIKFHLAIQHILTSIITNRLRNFASVKTWNFREISDLACYIMSMSKIKPYSDRELFGFLQGLNELRNRFIHEPSYEEFKDMMKNTRDRVKARKIFNGKYEDESAYSGHEDEKIKKAWLAHIAFIMAMLMSFKDKRATVGYIGSITRRMIR